ncbi:MAG: hypothetical protein R3Y61_01145 [Rikenellaceae bacterium]
MIDKIPLDQDLEPLVTIKLIIATNDIITAKTNSAMALESAKKRINVIIVVT